jgi:hypothetical protein
MDEESWEGSLFNMQRLEFLRNRILRLKNGGFCDKGVVSKRRVRIRIFLEIPLMAATQETTPLGGIQSNLTLKLDFAPRKKVV